MEINRKARLFSSTFYIRLALFSCFDASRACSTIIVGCCYCLTGACMTLPPFRLYLVILLHFLHFDDNGRELVIVGRS